MSTQEEISQVLPNTIAERMDGTLHMLPASSNWYLSKVSDCNNKGIFAYGANNLIILLDLQSRRIKATLNGHSKKVNAVEFHKHYKNYLFSASTDKTIRVWDISTKQCILIHKNCYKTDVICLSLSPLPHFFDLLVTAEQDCLYVTKIVATFPSFQSDKANDDVRLIEGLKIDGEVQKIDCNKLSIKSKMSAVCCSSSNGYEVAVGLFSGVILIVNWKTKSIVHTLAGHTDQIQTLSFAPSPSMHARYSADRTKSIQSLDQTQSMIIESNENHQNQNDIPNDPMIDSTSPHKHAKHDDFNSSNHFNQADSTNFPSLLASGSKDKEIKLWNTKTARLLTTFSPPFSKSTGAQKGKSDQRTWISVNWNPYNPNQIISSAYSGEIFSWNYQSTNEKFPLCILAPENHLVQSKWNVKRFAAGKAAIQHSRTVFNIAFSPFSSQIVTTSMVCIDKYGQIHSHFLLFVVIIML